MRAPVTGEARLPGSHLCARLVEDGSSSAPYASLLCALLCGLQESPLARLLRRLLSALARRALPREPPARLYVPPRERLLRQLARPLSLPPRVLLPLRVPRSRLCGLRRSPPGPSVGGAFSGLLRLPLARSS